MASSSTPTASKATRRSEWTIEERNKLDKYLVKEESGATISNEKWENSFQRHSMSSIKAKRRHRIQELIKQGLLSGKGEKKEIGESKRKKSAQANQELFNVINSKSDGEGELDSSDDEVPSSTPKKKINPSIPGKFLFKLKKN